MLLGIVITVWLLSAYYSYRTMNKWFLNCETKPWWKEGEFLTAKVKAMNMFLSLMGGPLAVITNIFTFSWLVYPPSKEPESKK